MNAARMIEIAHHLTDMGERVAGNEGRSRHYAGEKLYSALRCAAEGLAIAGYTDDEIVACARAGAERERERARWVTVL